MKGGIMNKKITSLTLTLLFLIYSYIFSIPAFSRKYGISCQTCHSPFPRLKDFGDEFAKYGFVISDKQTPRYFIETGDEKLSLIRDLPIALRLEGYATFKHKANEDRFEFGVPRILKFLSGGSIADNLSYYFYFYLDEKGEIAGLEDAYVMFNNVLGSNLDMYLGQFQVSDPLFKRELRLTIEDYQIYKKKIGQSKINLGYDRGLMLNYELPSKIDLTLEFLNGTGLIPATDDNYDIDKFINIFGRISKELAGQFRIGGLWYKGSENISNHINKVNMYGGDFTVTLSDKVEINFQYIQRFDSQPELNSSNVVTNGSFTEIIYTPKGDESNWYGALLFNYITSDLPGTVYKTLASNFGYLLRRNFRLACEFGYDFVSKSNQISLGFVSAF